MTIRVAISGIKGSYSEEAARNFFGAKAEIVECLSFEDAFHSVATNKTKYAVVPFKNKIIGDIKSVNEILNRTKLKISGEMRLAIRHVLAGTQAAELENLRCVSSHIEALKQCRKFFSGNKHLRQISGADTASSIRQVTAEDLPQNAAIGSARAAHLYGAKILSENIADDTENWTLFYLLENKL